MDLVNLMQSLSMDETSNSSNPYVKLYGVDINGEHTDIAIGNFKHKSLIIATQYEKIGSFLRVTIDQPEDIHNISEPVYSVQLLFGSENLEQQAAARYIAEQLNIKVPLMCFLCLKNYTPETVKSLTTVLLDTIKGNR